MSVAEQPVQYKDAKDMPDLSLLGSLGISSDIGVGFSLFEGEFPEGYKVPEEHFSTLVCHVAGPKVYWGERDSAQITQCFAGQICIDPALVARRGESTGQTRFAHCYLSNNFLFEMGQEILPSVSRNIELNPVLGEYDEPLQQFMRLATQRIVTREPIGKLELAAMGQLIGLRLLRAHSSLANRYLLRKSPGLDKKRLDLVVEYIQSHLEENLALADLASLVGLTPYHFARSFKDAAGQSPHAYVMNCRVEKAKWLLESQKADLASLALEVGFSSQQHFTTAFRRQTGITPGKYQKMLLN